MVEIAAQKATEARREASRLDLDLQLFNERYPPPPKRRGLLARRRTPDELRQDAQRQELEQQFALAQRDAAEVKAKSDELGKQAEAVEQAYAQLSQTREALSLRFRGELAAGVLGLVALGEAAQAREVLAEARRMQRGELAVATLWALVALLAEGPAAVLAALDETRLVWDQHADPVRHVLEALTLVQQGRGLNRQELGVFPRGNFSQPGLWRLYLLAGALAGWPYEPEAGHGHGHEPPDARNLAATLRAVQLYRAQGEQATWDLPLSPSALAAWAGKHDLVVRTLVANLLLRCGKPEHIPLAAGFEGLVDVPPLHYFANVQGRKARQPWPELLPRFRAQTLTAWPSPLASAWAHALACHVLVAAQAQAPAELYAQWYAESRGWPAGVLQWWTQAHLAGDPALLHNVREEPGGLFVLRA
jgi:hypothetical protein